MCTALEDERLKIALCLCRAAHHAALQTRIHTGQIHQVADFVQNGFFVLFLAALHAQKDSTQKR